MPEAARPPDDDDRVAVLREHIAPGDGVDDGLQAIAETAATLMGVPIALVSLIDKEEQFFGGCVGLSIAGTPREQAFCGYTILGDRLLEVPDARRDPRFSDNPLVTGAPKIVFYAGLPLTSASGYTLGTLCVIDWRPRHLSTEQRAHLEHLASAAERVIRKLGDLRAANAELAEALAKAREAEKAKSAFLASISHELRTPLNAVIGYAQLVEKRFQALGDASHNEYAHHILESGEHLLALINDILDVSRLEHDGYDFWPEPLDVSAELDWGCNMVAPRHEDAGGVIETRVEDGAEQICYDQRAFRQILLNLATNAVKYGGPSGKVSVAAAPATDGIRLTVADDGPGLPNDQQEQLFQPFARGTSRLSRQCEGTGLGLYLCKKLAERAGGWIRFESAPGCGTTVTVVMPSAAENEPTKTA